MRESVKVLTCPQCGAPIKAGANKCEYCGAEFFVTSLTYLNKYNKEGVNKYIRYYKDLLEDNPDNGKANCGMGVCYLDLKLYDFAIRYFTKAIEQIPSFSDLYYYYALALFKGRKPRTLTLTEVRKIEEYLNAAIQIDNTKAKYYYLLAFVKYDFYMKNGLRVNPPTFKELVDQATHYSCNKIEIDKMLQCVPITDKYLMNLIKECKT